MAEWVADEECAISKRFDVTKFHDVGKTRLGLCKISSEKYGSNMPVGNSPMARAGLWTEYNPQYPTTLG